MLFLAIAVLAQLVRFVHSMQTSISYSRVRICALLVPSLAFYENSDIVQLTADNFDRLVVQSDDIWVVQFYTTWCGHSENFVSKYKALPLAFEGVVKFGAVDSIDSDESVRLQNRYGVVSYPSLHIFSVDKQHPIRYMGKRNVNEIAEAALDKLKEKIIAKLATI